MVCHDDDGILKAQISSAANPRPKEEKPHGLVEMAGNHLLPNCIT
jgi:hypothetical protein